MELLLLRAWLGTSHEHHPESSGSPPEPKPSKSAKLLVKAGLQTNTPCRSTLNAEVLAWMTLRARESFALEMCQGAFCYSAHLTYTSSQAPTMAMDNTLHQKHASKQSCVQLSYTGTAGMLGFTGSMHTDSRCRQVLRYASTRKITFPYPYLRRIRRYSTRQLPNTHFLPDCQLLEGNKRCAFQQSSSCASGAAAADPCPKVVHCLQRPRAEAAATSTWNTIQIRTARPTLRHPQPPELLVVP